MHEHEHEELSLTNKILMISGIVVFIGAIFLSKQNISRILYVTAYILIGYDIIFKAIKHIFSTDMFDENLIMTVATLGALLIGEFNEGITVLILYKIGELLQDKAVDSSKKKIEKVLELKVNNTTLENGTVIKTADVNVGDVILVKAGDRIPLDSILLEDNAQIDMSALTGESTYIYIRKNEEILSGSINVGNAIYLKVIKEESESTVSKIIELVNNASKNKSRTEKYITRFCRFYTPIVLLIAILLPIVLQVNSMEALYRSLNFLVISCPCALVISIPLGFFVGMGTASKRGILAKGTNYLDILANIDYVFLDKTGTITEGNFEVNTIESVSELSKEQILEYIAIAESKSSHVIASAILNKFNNSIDKNRISEHKELAGYGIKAIIDNKKIICGNNKLLEENNIKINIPKLIGTIIYLAIDGEYKGYIIISDTIKRGAEELVDNLHLRGMKQVNMLTGDRKEVAEEVANKLKMDCVYYELLPQDKVKIIENAKKDGKKVAFIGDGINDSPVIAASDVGVAMGKGSDIAVETADIVLMTDELSKIVEGIDISRRTKSIVSQNIVIILITKFLFLLLSVLGLSTMWIAVFADVGITIIAIFNSLRILNYRKK